MKLLENIKVEQISLYQPPHWLAEVAAVITRLSPETALEDIKVDPVGRKREAGSAGWMVIRVAFGGTSAASALRGLSYLHSYN